MSNWQDFLTAAGGQWHADQALTFTGQPDPGPQAPQLAVLSHQRLLQVSGPDSRKFLQGQLTCDVDALGTDTSGLGAHCNHKGRMIADFRIAATGADTCTLRLHHSTLEPLQQSLGKYIVFSKAALHSAADACIIGLCGAGAGAVLSEVCGALPETVDTLVPNDRGAVIRVGEDRFECWLNGETAADVLVPLLARCRLRETGYWDLLDIRAGIGQVRGDASEAFIPQLLNYQAIGGISFTKGCYTGQEVVARMQYRGKLKRHMYRLRMTAGSASPPAPGSEIFAAGARQSVGNVVFSALAEETNIELLSVCTSEAASSGQMYLDAQRQQPLEVLSLPYAITK
ncbi:folate-binding protein YgfZ [Exilibacterium tricleocarpae]|uniref:Folate-binding protein YgfZ n=1 Tax=Exilibacterium tricleocarpae TaxID=2591008 RepID=A0A545U3J6_9GAMM|nr:folate-binding protein YgfZ [Exilibacterium tricleocarpae]TQV84041.1 folate-binding protein YgfZ [Exilibacterium tricleocarpae]